MRKKEDIKEVEIWHDENIIPEEHLDYFDDSYEEDTPPRFFNKISLILIALFMALLIISSSIPAQHLISVFSGKIVSSTLEEDYSFKLKYGDKVIFDPMTYEKLRAVYLDNQEHEIKVCLTGFKENSTYYVDGGYIPEIYSQTVYSVTSQMCNSSTIISLHSHPPLRCIFSEQDIKSFERFKMINPEGIIGLMCDEERMSFYGMD